MLSLSRHVLSISWVLGTASGEQERAMLTVTGRAEIGIGEREGKEVGGSRAVGAVEKGLHQIPETGDF